MKYLFSIIAFIFFCQLNLIAQYENPYPPTDATDREAAFDQRKALKEKSLFKEVAFQSVGPTVFGGRIADIEVSPSDPTQFFAAYASGGLWTTGTNGISFEPMFEKEAVMTIGDIAVNWKDSIIWVGTGEVNSSRSSYAGMGIYKSKDWGKSWEYLGLGESHHVGRIILHPNDPDVVWVAVLGHLYSPNPERGIYKTSDGGKNWKHTLLVNENAGAVDLVIDPKNSDVLYASIWERARRAWDFTEAGNGSGIYRSSDGGENWTLLSDETSGFPVGEGVGRIGLDIAYSNDKAILYAVVDNYFRRPKEDDKKEGLAKEDFREMTKEAFLSLKEDELQNFLENNGFPKKYAAKKVMEMVKSGEIKPIALVEYLEDANSLLFDTPVIGAEIYRSDDEGKTWKKTHEGYLDYVFNSYGYYFGQIRIDQQNPQKIYFMGVPVIKSDNGGVTFSSINGDNVHVDHHALWVNPQKTGHLILGNDGGINISYDDGQHWMKCNTPAVGQFYAIAVDMNEPYKIYGGLQDNGVWMGPSTYRASTSWHGSGDYPYDFLLGGDGMQVAVDTRDNRTVYTGFQFGNYYRINTASGKRKYITPKHELGERPYRWNWQTPIHLSNHNQDILYMGGNKVFRSFDQGEHFDAISPDLTKGGKQGDVAYGTLTSIHESSLRFGLIYAGSDDGLVHVSKDGGNNWELISEDLPDDLWVMTVFASQHDEATVYVSLNGYRWDLFDAYLYKSSDYGSSWTDISGDLPDEPVNVIIEDPVNPQILYVGTDHGLYISLDQGETFQLMDKDLPAVAVHDLVVHPRENELVVGTHGRSIYKADVSQIQQLTKEIYEGAILYVFDFPEKVKKRAGWGRQSAAWRKPYEPKTSFPIFMGVPDKLNFSIKTSEGLVVFEDNISLENGIQYVEYDFTINPDAVERLEKELNKDAEKEITLKKADNGKFYIPKGSYQLVFWTGKEEITKNWVIE